MIGVTKMKKVQLTLHLWLTLLQVLTLRSKAPEDIISIGSFVEVLVLNHYVLVRKIVFGAKGQCHDEGLFKEDGTTRTKKYEELSVAEKLQANCDLKTRNIILQGLPPDVYAIVNHHKVAKEIWDKVKLLMQGTKSSLQEKECKLYDEFDMNVINMSMRPVQESGQILDEEQLAFLADLCIPDGQAAQTTISNTNAFQTKELDTYDFDCDND
nr:hypothetical protein [Tanacetum cinerariifolium]